MQFGYHTTSFRFAGSSPESVTDGLVEHAQLLEAGGFEWLSLMDHFWQLPFIGYPDEPTIECYAGLSALARETDEMELSGLVTCVSYRNPALLAKQLSSLDVLSDGRALLGIGAGYFEPEYRGADIDFPDAPTRIRQMRDAIELVRTALTNSSPVDYDGEFFELDEFYCEPSRDVPVLVGGGGEELTLRVVAEHADRWNLPGVGPSEYERKLDVLRNHCEDVGRDYDDIAKTVTVKPIVRDDPDDARRVQRSYLKETVDGPQVPEDVPAVVGTPADVAAVIDEFVDVGVDTLQIEVPKNDRLTAECFVDEIVPQF